ncbi:MAG: type pilus assembly PilZ [Candidatus Sulfotelmatobacter sp.]|nr:type pilus assembly PilZ [Candidatus Sulfotelmatobacter sp.]
MSDEEGAGAAYLAALKQSTVQPATAAAPARAPIPLSPSETIPGKAVSTGRTGPVPEKRRSPRYRCQGSAHLREINGGVAMWATFSDISLHGCYVEAAAGYAVGSAIAIIIEADGLRFEAAGEVRVAYPGLGMGISFTRVSDEDRERLRALVRSLSQPSVIMGARVMERRPSGPQPDATGPVPNPNAALRAIQKFFEDRHVLGREEFLRILRKSQM